MTIKRAITVGFVLLLVVSAARAQNDLTPAQGDFIIRDFRFKSGEVLPELKLHYTTIGTPVRDNAGVVRNAVLILHGTGGRGDNFLAWDLGEGDQARPTRALRADPSQPSNARARHAFAADDLEALSGRTPR